MKRTISILLAIGAIASAQPALSNSSPSQPADPIVARLERRVAELDARLARTPIPQARGDAARVIERQRIRDQRNQLEGLIEKIRSGQAVSPAEIDRAFEAR